MIEFSDFLNVLDMAQDKGRYILAKCPFHADQNPSLLVFKDSWFRCLGCGANGRWITLWNKAKGQPITLHPEHHVNWHSPMKEWEDTEEVCDQGHMDLLQFPTLQWYIEMRGLSERVEPCEIGYRQGWYSFPVRDVEGNFQTAVFRAAPHVQEVTGMRYWCLSKPLPYVPDWAILEKKDFIVVVYGIFDALTLMDLRIPVITSTSGNRNFDAAWLDGYRKKVYVIPDKGEEEVGQKLANELGWRGKVIRLDYPGNVKDCNGYFEVGQREKLQAQLSNL